MTFVPVTNVNVKTNANVKPNPNPNPYTNPNQKPNKNPHSHSVSGDIIAGVILPTVNTLIRRRGHNNAWKLSTSSFPVRIEMLRLMNKMSAKILNFWIG